MLQQQINLYQDIEIKNPYERYTSWEILQKSIIIVSILMVCYFSLDFYTYLADYMQKKVLEKTLVSKMAEYSRQKDRFPQFFFTQTAADALKQLKSTIEKQNQILQLISIQTSFTGVFKTLSSTIVPDVWLTSFDIDASGAKIALDGKATSMTQLNQFLNNLTHSPTFKGYTILADNIEQVTKDNTTNQLIFHISIERHSE